MVGMLVAHTGDWDNPIVLVLEELDARSNQTDYRLKEKDLYFYESDGSIFDDYKIMRDEAYKRVAKEMGVANQSEGGIPSVIQALRNRFELQMSAEQVMQIARDFVNTWCWE